MVWSWIEEAGGWSAVTRLPFDGFHLGKSKKPNGKSKEPINLSRFHLVFEKSYQNLKFIFELKFDPYFRYSILQSLVLDG
jgi:hypothetical protein